MVMSTEVHEFTLVISHLGHIGLVLSYDVAHSGFMFTVIQSCYIYEQQNLTHQQTCLCLSHTVL